MSVLLVLDLGLDLVPPGLNLSATPALDPLEMPLLLVESDSALNAHGLLARLGSLFSLLREVLHFLLLMVGVDCHAL
jgi:hypothetical protein